ncbi:MAG: hypothetical protein M3Z67_02145 [Commensalibacter sp.]|nr:hypothetical protein [Commensalibacter sp.]
MLFKRCLITLWVVSSFLILSTESGWAEYRRCWLYNGRPTVNCNPADGYFFKKIGNQLKKCNVQSGELKKNCVNEEGTALILDKGRWYKCLVINGKIQSECNLAQGYGIIK